MDCPLTPNCQLREEAKRANAVGAPSTAHQCESVDDTDFERELDEFVAFDAVESKQIPLTMPTEQRQQRFSSTKLSSIREANAETERLDGDFNIRLQLAPGMNPLDETLGLNTFLITNAEGDATLGDERERQRAEE